MEDTIILTKTTLLTTITTATLETNDIDVFPLIESIVIVVDTQVDLMHPQEEGVRLPSLEHSQMQMASADDDNLTTDLQPLLITLTNTNKTLQFTITLLLCMNC